MTEPTDLRARPPEAWFQQAWKTIQLGHTRLRRAFWRGFATGVVVTALAAGAALLWWWR